MILTVKDPTEGGRTIASKIAEFCKGKQQVVLGLSGGRSILEVLDALQHCAIEWANIHIFVVDDRVVPITDPESNSKLIQDHLVSKISIPKTNWHPFRLGGSIADSVAAYTEELAMVNGYDIVVLGTGEDGHVAAVFPNHHSIRNPSQGFIWFDDSPKLPARRVTATKAELQKASLAFALFYGEPKRAALQQFVATGDPESCPSALVKDTEYYAITDCRD